MFGNLGEMASLFKKAKDIQRNMAALKEEMARSEFSASSADGGVVAVVSGDFQIKSIAIAPSEQTSDRLGDHIAIAVNAALAAAKSAMQSKMNEITGGLNVPGLF